MWPLWASTSIYTGFMLCVAAIPPIYLEQNQASIYVGVGIPVLVIVAAFVHYILVSRPLTKLLERIDSTLEQRHITESHQRNVLKRANDLLDPNHATNNSSPGATTNSSSPQMSLNYSMKHQQRLIDDLGVGSYHSEMFNLQAHVKDLFQSLIREQQALYKLQIETVNTAAKSPQGGGAPGGLLGGSSGPVGGNFTPLGTSLNNSLSLPAVGGTTPRGTSVAQQSIYGRRAASATHRQGSAATTAAPATHVALSPAPETPPPNSQPQSNNSRKPVNARVATNAEGSILSTSGDAPPQRNSTTFMENSSKGATGGTKASGSSSGHAVVMIKDPLEDPQAFSEPMGGGGGHQGAASPGDGDDRTSYASLDSDGEEQTEFESRRLASESMQPQLLATPGQYSSTTGARSPSAMVPSPVPIIKQQKATVHVDSSGDGGMNGMKGHGRQNSNQILGGGPSPLGVVSPLILERGARFPGDNKNICLFMKRSKNANLVVYEGKVEVPMDPHQKPGLNLAKPLEGYWLDVDPKYVEKARKKGKMDDREELNTFEFKFAYGFNCSRSTLDNSTFTVVMKALEERNLILGLDKLMVKESKYVADRSKSLGRLDELHGDASSGGNSPGGSTLHSVPMVVPTMKLKLNGMECIMDHIYVHTSEGWGLPSVEYVELHGFALKTGDKVMELIQEKKKKK